MKFHEYIENLRGKKLTGEVDFTQEPMTEKEFENWIKPTKETGNDKELFYDYQKVYLRLKKLLAQRFASGNEEERKQITEQIKELNAAYIPVAEKFI